MHQRVRQAKSISSGQVKPNPKQGAKEMKAIVILIEQALTRKA